MDKDLFMMVWRAVAPEITKYYTYRLEDYIKYNNHNPNNKVNRLSYGLQLFNRCVDRQFAWSLACRYDCRELAKYLRENPIKIQYKYCWDFFNEVAKNGRIEYIDMLDKDDIRACFADCNGHITRGKIHIRFWKWLIDKNLHAPMILNSGVLNPQDLTCEDLILLQSKFVKISLTCELTDDLKSNVHKFNGFYAAYLAVLAGQSVDTIMKYMNPDFGSNNLFIKAIIQRSRNLNDLNTLLTAFKKNKMKIDRKLLFAYAILDGHLDTIKLVAGKRKKILIPTRPVPFFNNNIIESINVEKYDLEAIKYLYEEHQAAFNKIEHRNEFLSGCRFDILEYYISKNVNIHINKVGNWILKSLPAESIKWLHCKGFIGPRVYLNMLTIIPFEKEDIIEHLKNKKIKSLTETQLINISKDQYIFKIFYEYFASLKIKKNDLIAMLNILEKPPRHLRQICLDVLLRVDTSLYNRLSTLIKSNPMFLQFDVSATVMQYILDH